MKQRNYTILFKYVSWYLLTLSNGSTGAIFQSSPSWLYHQSSLWYHRGPPVPVLVLALELELSSPQQDARRSLDEPMLPAGWDRNPALAGKSRGQLLSPSHLLLPSPAEHGQHSLRAGENCSGKWWSWRATQASPFGETEANGKS